MIYLKHNVHGIHIAYNDAEVRNCKKNGWVECDIKEEHKKARKAKAKAAKDKATTELESLS